MAYCARAQLLIGNVALQRVDGALRGAVLTIGVLLPLALLFGRCQLIVQAALLGELRVDLAERIRIEVAQRRDGPLVARLLRIGGGKSSKAPATSSSRPS